MGGKVWGLRMFWKRIIKVITPGRKTKCISKKNHIKILNASKGGSRLILATRKWIQPPGIKNETQSKTKSH
jgi:hypothetical protein